MVSAAREGPASSHPPDVGFIICEDGSRDNTKDVLTRLAKELPLRLNLTGERRGYSRAVRFVRRAFSRFFYLLYQLVLHVPVHDPSCPYVLIPRRGALQLVDHLGAMQQGFWWEFVARVHRGGFRIAELPVHHRLRSAGETQVYRWSRMPETRTATRHSGPPHPPPWRGGPAYLP